MGLLFCDCRATANITGGSIVIDPPGPIPPVTIGYSIDVDICPDCLIDGSNVTVTFTIPILGEITFQSTAVGFPICTEGELTVEVTGTVTGVPTPVTITITLGEDGLCIENPPSPLPSNLPCLPVDVVFGDPCPPTNG